MSPMPPMPPMPRGSVPRSRAGQGVRGFPPFSGRLLPGQDEATGARACERNKASCHELSAAALWIEQGAHRLNRGVRLSGHRDGRGITNSDPILRHM